MRLLQAENYRITIADDISKKTPKEIERSLAIIIDCIENFVLLNKLPIISKIRCNILTLIKATYTNKKYIYAFGAADYISSPPTAEELSRRLHACERVYAPHRTNPPITVTPQSKNLSGSPSSGISSGPNNRKETQLATSAARYLTNNLSEPHTLGSLARAIGTNRNSLCIAFQNIYGQSVFSWLREQRMHEAARRLKQTSASIQNICSEVGYSTPANFSTAFKKYFGVSPRQYRKKWRNQKIIVRIKKFCFTAADTLITVHCEHAA